MDVPKSIKYEPYFSEAELKLRIDNLSDAIGRVLGVLQCWEHHEDCGANDIADNEAKFVQEVLGFLYLLELAQKEEIPGAIKSVNKALWEIEMVRQIGGVEVNHPWKGEAAGGRSYETRCSSFFKGFDYLDYDTTPEDEALDVAPFKEADKRQD
jgi:hypothetical protein